MELSVGNEDIPAIVEVLKATPWLQSLRYCRTNDARGTLAGGDLTGPRRRLLSPSWGGRLGGKWIPPSGEEKLVFDKNDPDARQGFELIRL